MQKLIGLVAATGFGAAFAGLAAGIGLAYFAEAGPTGASARAAEASRAADYFESLTLKAEAAGNEDGTAKACGRSSKAWEGWERLAKTELDAGRIDEDQYAKLDLAFLGAVSRGEKTPCRSSVVSAAD